MWLPLCLAVVVAGLAWWTMSRLSLHRRQFAVPHMTEFGRGLAALKQAAMRAVGDGGDASSPDDARILRTSAGLAFLYSISMKAPGTYVHHASVSIPGRVTARAVGATFILLWARLLGVAYERLTLGVSPTTVHHAEFVSDENEQANFAQRPVQAPTVELRQAFQSECAGARPSLRWEQSSPQA